MSDGGVGLSLRRLESFPSSSPPHRKRREMVSNFHASSPHKEFFFSSSSSSLNNNKCNKNLLSQQNDDPFKKQSNSSTLWPTAGINMWSGFIHRKKTKPRISRAERIPPALLCLQEQQRRHAMCTARRPYR